ncbi:hypothetical protein PTQ19_10160 [Microbacterium esteraromaticum]|uniref:hypothetical protein n=1 Tax=Microbacterium esteraromaticum TaxID=57043 RepID=UPI00236741ED|nr:hypothetical protein [Microbacterium esteraromaticum]WDH77884.1 hypothetical protein PTQ19_10160 [Microbacterium esteraromaticum]
MVEEKKKEPGSFAAMLASIRPSTDVELAENLSKLIEEVKATGKKGTLSVVFEVKPVNGGDRLVIINDALKLRLPERTREGTTAFVTDSNGLSRSDPTSSPLFTDEDIRDAGANVNPRTGEIKEAPEA